jgi:hypothetical protein
MVGRAYSAKRLKSLASRRWAACRGERASKPGEWQAASGTLPANDIA